MHTSRYYGIQVSSRTETVKRLLLTHHCSRIINSTHSKTLTTMNDEKNCIREGKAEINQPSSVFYNPVQEFNRDLTINVISEYVQDFIKEKRQKEEQILLKKDRSKGKQENASDDGKNNNPQESHDHISSLPLDPANLRAGRKCEEGVSILEGLSASGLRSVRFGLEIPGVKKIVVNDFDENAVEVIKENIAKNKLTDILEANFGDAAMVMYQNRSHSNQFDVIDLDPYGSPAKFLDSAVQSVSDGGLLCVTATDMAVLCGKEPESSYSKYGSLSLKMKSCHEMALRILLQSIESHANRYSRYIVPLISISADFYIRVFLRVYTRAAKVKESVAKMAMVHFCTGCTSFILQRLAKKVVTKGDNFKVVPGASPVVSEKCEHCGHHHTMGGPIWADPIHDKDFLSRVIDRAKRNSKEFNTAQRIEGMLSLALEEEADCPLYYLMDDLYQVLHCSPMSLQQIRSVLLNAGFRVSCSHASKNAIKTNASNRDIWDILREWVKKNPIAEKRLTPGSVTKAILDQDAVLNVSFKQHPQANPESRQKKLVRWQVNPTSFWGPGTRAKKSGVKNSHIEKAKRLQNKKRKRAATEENKKFESPCKKMDTE